MAADSDAYHCRVGTDDSLAMCHGKGLSLATSVAQYFLTTASL